MEKTKLGYADKEIFKILAIDNPTDGDLRKPIVEYLQNPMASVDRKTRCWALDLIGEIRPSSSKNPRFGIPETVTTDQGSVFTSRKMQELTKEMGFKLLTSMSYYAQYQQQQQQQTPKKADWEIAIEKLAAYSIQFQEETRTNKKNTTTSIKNLEVQMGQIAQQLASNSQAPGTLPSGTVTNPREHNTVNAVTTRSGKSTEVNDIEKDGLIEVGLEIKETKVQDEEAIPPPVPDKEKAPKPIIKLPYPPRQKKKNQHEKNFEKFLEMFKKLEINIPFSEALEQMPIYAKFMKDIISKKRSTDTEPIILTETCSAALIDLGASVSLMPLSIYKKLAIGSVQDT
ncbi:uncharacterized protein LOC127103917 [Lathyrus oleraceus]|uniref:uncharacterized protein LOC127103917 n=1 Tax=Pisum sativum TaxID=3888 RepID=UPI0021D0BF55|nr:uncharacterized protein LOC127103917 [Pisum sativum]